MSWKERAIREIKEFVEKQKRSLREDLEWIENKIDEIVRKYLETLEEIPKLPKLTDDEILFVKTIDLGKLFDDSIKDWFKYGVHVSCDPWEDTIDINIKSGKGNSEYRVPFEKGLKVKIIIYKEVDSHACDQPET